MRDDPILPLVFTRDEALQAGMSRHQIANRVRVGSWRQLRRAIYIRKGRYAALTPREQHTTAVVATLMSRPDAVAASHLSAAAAYGWVLPLAGAGPVTVTDGDLDSPTRQAPNLTIQVASLPSSDVRTFGVSVAQTDWRIRVTSRAESPTSGGPETRVVAGELLLRRAPSAGAANARAPGLPVRQAGAFPRPS